MPALHEKVWEIRQQRIDLGHDPVPALLQGISKGEVRQELEFLNLAEPTMVDVVFALLDNVQPSWFGNAPDNASFSTGASTAHLFCHVGILQRGEGKLDREGRDYFIKPLCDAGIVEQCYLDPASRTFVHGHPNPKSPNSAYRLEEAFLKILLKPAAERRAALEHWASVDETRKRRAFQAEMARTAAARVDTKHADLIQSSVENYSPRFLPGFGVLYVDDADGERVSDDEAALMRGAGLSLELGDAMPDVLLWHEQLDWLWVIEAVTSDGEVDLRKQKRLREFSDRHGKAGVGFTTTYPTWKLAAQRQARHKNVAPGSFIWIEESPSVQFRVESFTYSFALTQQIDARLRALEQGEEA